VDKLLDYEGTRNYVNEVGFDQFVAELEKEYSYRFFSCSEAWLMDPKFICKLKGARGDLIIGWKGVHD
jgi:hypothetical protein